MLVDRPVLGLRSGDPVSPVHDRSDLFSLLTKINTRRATDIDEIIRRGLNGLAEIPIDFLFETGLDKLAWQQVYHPNALSAVYLGVAKSQDDPIFVDEAEAIIAVHSYVRDEKLSVKSIELSTVVSDSLERRRVLVVAYDPKTLTLNKVAVSISESEKQEAIQICDPRYAREARDSLESIPTKLDFLSVTIPTYPTLVSSKMVGLALDDCSLLVANKIGDRYVINPFLEDYGFYEDQEGKENRVIGRKNERRTNSWHVIYPDSLIKVSSV